MHKSSETDYFIALTNQFIEINLFGASMISFLHTVEIKKFASGL